MTAEFGGFKGFKRFFHWGPLIALGRVLFVERTFNGIPGISFAIIFNFLCRVECKTQSAPNSNPLREILLTH